tara:strand:+ start:133 stop:303 length:171 start_codon:yes stop_codon:yes gene_type:complete
VTEYNMYVNVHTVALLEKAVQLYLSRWPGGNPEEQEDLKVLLTGLQKILLEDKFLK